MKRSTGYFAYVAIACCLGIAVSTFSFHWGLLLVIVLYTGWIFHKDKSIFITVSVLVAAILFCAYTSLTDHFNASKHTSMENRFQATVATPFQVDGNKITFQIKSDQNEMMLVEYYMKAQEEIELFQSFHAGDTCRLLGSLKAPLPATNPHAFDHKKHLYYQHIHWMLSLSEPPSFCFPSKKTHPFNALKKYRENGIQFINDSIEQPVSGFMISLIYGDRNYIKKETLDSYQLLGLVHLLAISGLHVGIITAAVFYIGIRVGFSRQSVNVLLIAGLPFYAIIAGGAPSVMRAVTMTAVALLYMARNKRLLSVDAIGIACISILLLNPYYLFHIGFQLSFIVSLTLLLSVKKINSIQNKIFQIFFISVIAQFASLPVLLYHFSQVSLWSPMLNVVFVPFYSLFVLPYSFVILFCLYLFPALAPLLLPILQWPLELMNSFAVWLARLPIGTLVFGKPSLWMLLMYAAALVFFFYNMDSGEKKRVLLGAGVMALCLLFQWNSAYFNHNGQVTFIDIGQGDAILIQLPYRKGTYLIDTGGTFSFPQEEWEKRSREFNSGESVLVPYLKAEGIRHLDKLILTHGDFDHIGNVSKLWGQIEMKELYVPLGFGGGEFLEDEILEEAENRGVSVKVIKDVEGWKVSSYEFLFLHPKKEYQDKNDGSIVLYAVIGGKSWLFTGDIEEEGERDFLTQYPGLQVDVLKAAHHGSKTSTSDVFVSRVQPKVAVVSAGRNNRYGHPHEEVVTRLEQVGAIIYRTDENGAITYNFTHRKGTFSTVLP